MSRYTPSRNYIIAGALALVMGAACGWLAVRWAASSLPAVLFVLTGVVMVVLSRCPTIEIHPHHLRVGRRVVGWGDIHAVDRTGWMLPLVVILTLVSGRRQIIIYPGSLENSQRLLMELRRRSHAALIDGEMYDDHWRTQEGQPDGDPEHNQAPRYPVLPPGEEAEVERLFQRLKSVGHLDSKSTDEN